MVKYVKVDFDYDEWWIQSPHLVEGMMALSDDVRDVDVKDWKEYERAYAKWMAAHKKLCEKYRA